MSASSGPGNAPGRKPDEAPEGFKTVSETAHILGVSPSAVRQMLQSARLPYMPDEQGEPVRTPGGEPRYYIPTQAVADEVERRKRAATPPDVEAVQREVQVQAARVLRDVLNELRRHDKRVEGALDEHREQLEELVRDLSSEIKKQTAEAAKERTILLARLTSLEVEMAKNRKEASEFYEEASQFHEATAEFHKEILGLVREYQRQPNASRFRSLRRMLQAYER